MIGIVRLGSVGRAARFPSFRRSESYVNRTMGSVRRQGSALQHGPGRHGTAERDRSALRGSIDRRSATFQSRERGWCWVTEGVVPADRDDRDARANAGDERRSRRVLRAVVPHFQDVRALGDKSRAYLAARFISADVRLCSLYFQASPSSKPPPSSEVPNIVSIII